MNEIDKNELQLKELQDLKIQSLNLIKNLDEKILACKKKQLLKCVNDNHGKGCGASQSKGETVFIQTHWYEHPWGCTGGDCWHLGEGQWICSSCGKRNRLIYYDGEYSKYEFKSIEEEYDD